MRSAEELVSNVQSILDAWQAAATDFLESRDGTFDEDGHWVLAESVTELVAEARARGISDAAFWWAACVAVELEQTASGHLRSVRSVPDERR